MLNRLDVRGEDGDLRALLPRPTVDGDGPTEAVRAILADVRNNDDEALLRLTETFDGVRPDTLVVGSDEMHAALDRIDPVVADALRAAERSIRAHHEHQVRSDVDHRSEGFAITSRTLPVDRAGCYVPGGRAVYPSTVLMTAVPARVAGVADVVLCVPPGPDGRIPDLTLAAAAVAGVDRAHPVGGAQAIAAMAFGTGSVEPVDVIVGPGNVYVAIAKREVAGLVGVPSAFAGPSEVVVIADASVPADLAAIDVVVQAEHGPDGLAWLVTPDEDVADAVDRAMSDIVSRSPRADDIRSTLDVAGYAVIVDDMDQAVRVANAIAPEHLQLMVDDPERWATHVRHAGAVFCGEQSPASLGDYIAGPSHVLPTAGTARFAGALTVADFTKDLHIIRADDTTIERVGDHVVSLATAEGLDAHAESIRMRQR